MFGCSDVYHWMGRTACPTRHLGSGVGVASLPSSILPLPTLGNAVRQRQATQRSIERDIYAKLCQDLSGLASKRPAGLPGTPAGRQQEVFLDAQSRE